MKTSIIKFLLVSGILIVGSGCSDFLDVNDNPNAAKDVKEGLLVTSTETITAYNVTGGFPARVSSYWTQQVSFNTPGPDIDSYQMLASTVENTWTFDLYAGILKNLKVLEEKTTDNGNNYYCAIAKIMLAYNMGVVTDLWNDVPYSDAFQGSENSQPKYDSQEKVYEEIGQLLNDGIELAGKSYEGEKPGSDDLIYGGDMDEWTKFAYMLKARYALRLINAPGKDKAAQCNAALAALKNGFSGSGDNAAVPFSTSAGGEAPWYQFIQKWSGAYMASTFINMLKASNDPRISVIAEKAKEGNAYIGHVIGSEHLTDDEVSAVGDLFAKADAPVYLATYAEALFIKAEATYWTKGFAAAQPILTAAVKETAAEWGMDPESLAMTTYITAHCTLTSGNAYQVIMTQKYISNFLSLEAFNDWRRSGFPKLSPVENAYINTIPRRWVYSSQEVSSNPQPEQSGVKLTGRVWWDTK
ncbi:SusD/RagB family nutrient-binding outer membrane lipoprotein [Compostibacter hankyongensis]|uniref:SusD/RagB family nutrient-binding outer membrane lipoprotein n=1 Tax=Compostibacter hankyongensis TaxID=1007089 RepID=A0ABP8FSW4_9BACT